MRAEVKDFVKDNPWARPLFTTRRAHFKHEKNIGTKAPPSFDERLVESNAINSTVKADGDFDYYLELLKSAHESQKTDNKSKVALNTSAIEIARQSPSVDVLLQKNEIIENDESPKEIN